MRAPRTKKKTKQTAENGLYAPARLAAVFLPLFGLGETSAVQLRNEPWHGIRFLSPLTTDFLTGLVPATTWFHEVWGRVREDAA